MTYTAKNQPRKLLMGTPKYDPPCRHTHARKMVDHTGSSERSQATMTNAATNGSVRMLDPAKCSRTSPKITLATVHAR